MQIHLNKDLEKEYKNEIVKGFAPREIVSLVLAAVIIIGITVFVWWKFGISPDVCVFIGIPFAIPILVVGFKEVQGLTVEAYLKEIIYEYRTGILSYDADELPSDAYRVFTMDSGIGKKRKWRIGK